MLHTMKLNSKPFEVRNGELNMSFAALNRNRPRENYYGFRESSDVCIKRKICNRLQDMEEKIFVQCDDRCDEGFKSLHDRANGCTDLAALNKGKNTDEDADKIKNAIETLFENDCSSARPEGSMEVRRLYWYKHDSKTPRYSSAKVHRLLNVELKDGIDRPRSFDDYDITLDKLKGLEPEIFEG